MPPSIRFRPLRTGTIEGTKNIKVRLRTTVVAVEGEDRLEAIAIFDAESANIWSSIACDSFALLVVNSAAIVLLQLISSAQMPLFHLQIYYHLGPYSRGIATGSGGTGMVKLSGTDSVIFATSE